MSSTVALVVHHSEVLLKIVLVHVWDQSTHSGEVRLKSIWSGFLFSSNLVSVFVQLVGESGHSPEDLNTLLVDWLDLEDLTDLISSQNVRRLRVGIGQSLHILPDVVETLERLTFLIALIVVIGSFLTAVEDDEILVISVEHLGIPQVL